MKSVLSNGGSEMCIRDRMVAYGRLAATWHIFTNVYVQLVLLLFLAKTTKHVLCLAPTKVETKLNIYS